jgi:hypothetical protein
MIIKLAEIFNIPLKQQNESAKPNFTPIHLTNEVKKFHPASTTSNNPLIQNAKKEACSGVPKTKWWKKMEKAQLN